MRYDLWRIAGFLLPAVAIGWVFDQLLLCLLVATMSYLVWQQRNLIQLQRWMRQPKRIPAPDARGVFDMICCEVERLQDRHRKRKKKLSGYLKQFQEATAALPDATVVLGKTNDIQWANTAAETLLGIEWPQDQRQRITSLVRDPDLVEFLKVAANTKATLDISSPVKPDIYLSLRVVPYGQTQRLLVARDVTRLHRLNMIRQDFVANVSHELRTPLTVIRGYVETLIGQQEQCPESWQASLQQLESQTRRMQDIIDDLLLLSRLEQNEILEAEVVMIAAMLGNILEEAQSLSGERQHLFELAADPELKISGKRQELFSAFSNLVFNAVTYTPSKGIIKIRWYRDETGAHLEVNDNGIGIPEQHIPRVTERFYRVDGDRSRDSGGTGLGLAIVKHVLNRHNATLHIESAFGEGSTFRCDFPPQTIVEALPKDQGYGEIPERVG